VINLPSGPAFCAETLPLNAGRWCRDEIIACIAALTGAGELAAGLDLARLTVELAYREAAADLSTNAALVLAKSAGLPPGTLAEYLAAALRSRPAVKSVAIGRTGVVTWRLAESFWQARLGELVGAGRRYGDSDIGRGQAIGLRCAGRDVLDFLPLDQARAAIIGEALATLLTKAGFTVSRDGLTDDAATALPGRRITRTATRLKIAAVTIAACHDRPGGLICRPAERAARPEDSLTLSDLADETDKDTLRFIMLTRPHGQAQEIDLVEARDRSHGNPVWLVQHAYARVQSVLRHAAAELDLPDLDGPPALSDLGGPPGLSDLGGPLALSDLGGPLARADLTLLADPAELALIRRLARWPSLIEHAAVAREPHHAAIFLQDLASDFHRLWNKGKDHASLRFVDRDDRVMTLARLALLQGVAAVIESGLQIVGIEPVREMR
jgi:arginyl-tRNA synthetase